MPPALADQLRAELVKLAQLGHAMRKAQRAYFDARKRQPHVKPVAELNASRDLERRFDAAVRDALTRERVELPGFGEGGEAA
jgi:hypothetical protein